MQNTINFQSKKQFGGNLTTKKSIDEAIAGNKAWPVFKQVRTTPGYWDTAKKDVLAMIQQIGPFTFWLTFSANDLNWVTPIKQVAAHEGTILSDEDIDNMPFLDRVKWINKNPAAVTLYIYDVFRQFVFDFQLKTEVYGKIKDYVIKVEFQQRGTPHIHEFVWIEDAMIYGIHSDQQVCNYIDKYISCSILCEKDDPELYQLVKGCQTHRCLKVKCQKKNSNTCKYDFPRLPSDKTLNSKGHDCEEYISLSPEQKNNISENFSTVKKHLQENGSEYCSLNEFLASINISYHDYITCLIFAFKEPTVIHKRMPNECWINSYNTHSLRLLKSNQDIAFALRMYGCICYLLSYLWVYIRSRALSQLQYQSQSQLRIAAKMKNTILDSNFFSLKSGER